MEPISFRNVVTRAPLTVPAPASSGAAVLHLVLQCQADRLGGFLMPPLMAFKLRRDSGSLNFIIFEQRQNVIRASIGLVRIRLRGDLLF